MRDQVCNKEQAVVKAAVSGQWPAELKTHAETCVSCRAVVGLSRSLRRLADSPTAQLPPASYVWWQSRVRDSRAAQLRASRLYAITHTATVLMSIIVLTVWIIWSWSQFEDGVRSGLNSMSLRSVTDSPSGVAVLIMIIVALLCVNVTLTIRRFVSYKQSK